MRRGSVGKLQLERGLAVVRDADSESANGFDRNLEVRALLHQRRISERSTGAAHFIFTHFGRFAVIRTKTNKHTVDMNEQT